MLDGADLSKDPVPWATELCQNVQDIFPYVFCLAAGAHNLSSLFWVCFGFLRTVLVMTIGLFGRTFSVRRLQQMGLNIVGNEDLLLNLEALLDDVFFRTMHWIRGKTGPSNIKGFVPEYVHGPVCHESEMLSGKFRGVLDKAELLVGQCVCTSAERTGGKMTFSVVRILRDQFSSARERDVSGLVREHCSSDGEKGGRIRDDFPKSR